MVMPGLPLCYCMVLSGLNVKQAANTDDVGAVA